MLNSTVLGLLADVAQGRLGPLGVRDSRRLVTAERGQVVPARHRGLRKSSKGGRENIAPTLPLILLKALYLMMARFPRRTSPVRGRAGDGASSDIMDLLEALGVVAPLLAAGLTVLDARLRERRSRRPTDDE